MFGLFKKKAPAEVKEKLKVMANTSYAFLGSQINHDSYRPSNPEIQFTNDDHRQKFEAAIGTELREALVDLPSWRARANSRNAEVAERAEYTINDAAFLVTLALTLVDLICKGALQYPDDRELSDFAAQAMTMNLAALDHMLKGPHRDLNSMEPGLSAEVMMAMPHINQFFEMRMGQVLS